MSINNEITTRGLNLVRNLFGVIKFKSRLWHFARSQLPGTRESVLKGEMKLKNSTTPKQQN